MASCACCGRIILFGGKTYGQDRYCDDNCASVGIAIIRSRAVAPAAIADVVQRLWNGPCPKCNGPGPVDVHTSHTVFSFILMTSWQSHPQLSCRRCGVKRQAGAAAVSLFAGWWGIPWGFFVTPIQVVRNIVGMVGGPSRDEPSQELEKQVRIQLGSQVQ